MDVSEESQETFRWPIISEPVDEIDAESMFGWALGFAWVVSNKTLEGRSRKELLVGLSDNCGVKWDRLPKEWRLNEEEASACGLFGLPDEHLQELQGLTPDISIPLSCQTNRRSNVYLK